MSRICLVGAGVISRVHAEALQGRRIVAVVDPNTAAARRLAEQTGATAYGSVEEALAAGDFERAHVLVPPSLHAAAALPLLAAGKAVLIEKPLAASHAECQALLAAAAQGNGTPGGALLGVNQNFVYHPAFARLRAMIDGRVLGPVRFVSCHYNVPLRQMAARQFGHWMFAAPGNILLEQAVHPLSQLLVLTGPVGDLRVLADPAHEIAPGLPFCSAVTVALRGSRLPAELRFAVGQNFPFWQITAICDDGVIVADILANRVASHARTRWLEAVDGLLSGLGTAAALARDSIANAARYVAATAKLRGRGDPFFLSMQTSIAAFHAAADAGHAPLNDGRFGADLVQLCEAIRDQAFPSAAQRPPQPVPSVAPSGQACDVAILGGTGFIGAQVVQHCVAAGLSVSVMARSTANLPAVFQDARVRVLRGDIRDAAAVRAAIGAAPVVINLAHGGGGGSWDEIRAAMVGGAETVARVCLEAKVRRLIYVSSIAALYLGPQPAAVTGATPPDPLAEQRSDYARAKAVCEQVLQQMQAREGLKLVILRPGVVVGAGSSPFHGGLGFFNTEQHCIGWNDGRNPLPFVLVEDVADAVRRAIAAEGIDGHCYNLVGDVRPSARDYVADLARALQRPLRFHPQSPTGLWLEDVGKWVIKRATGRKVAMPSRRDFVSRGMRATFDCTDAKRDLGWQPVADAAVFREGAVLAHAPDFHNIS